MSSLRILYISGSIGLGHANRDLAIARELRCQHPSAEIMWLAGEPARQVIREAGENVLPESAGIAETGLAEKSAGQFSLDLIKYVIRAQDAWKRTVAQAQTEPAAMSGRVLDPRIKAHLDKVIPTRVPAVMVARLVAVARRLVLPDPRWPGCGRFRWPPGHAISPGPGSHPSAGGWPRSARPGPSAHARLSGRAQCKGASS